MRKYGDFLIDNGVLIEYTGSAAEVVVPEKIKEIGFEAFYRLKCVISVRLPKGLTRIGRSAFYRDDVIGCVCLHDGVKSIDNGTVRECPHFTHFYRSVKKDNK